MDEYTEEFESLQIEEIPGTDEGNLFSGMSNEFRQSQELFELVNKIVDTFYPWHGWAKLTLVNRQVIFFDKGSAAQDRLCSEALDLTLKALKTLWTFERIFHESQKVVIKV